MTTHCSLSSSDGTDAATWAVTSALLDHADRAANTALVSDQARLEARQGVRTLWQIRGGDTEASPTGNVQTDGLVGIAIIGAGELDLVIDPAFRGRGFASCALPQLLDATSGSLRTWVHGENATADALLSRVGFVPVRALLKLELTPQRFDEAAQAASNRSLPPGYRVTAFTEARSEEWLALNALVFAEHPEQGQLTEKDLATRLAEPWFDAQDFLLLLDENAQLVGYCWLKTVATEGEIYVIGVAPELAGRGLGSALFAAGVQRLAQRHLSCITLYVEAENEPALKLYRAFGFTESLRSKQWMLARDSHELPE